MRQPAILPYLSLPASQFSLRPECWRLGMPRRRMTRLTNGFSKKWDNLDAALALHFGHYSFRRIHGSLRVTPANGRRDRRVRGVEEP